MRTATFLFLLASAACASDDLFDAARKGDVTGVKTALDKGADINAKWRYEQTALFIAAFHGRADVVKLLLERGADLKVKDTFYGMTLLDAATNKNSLDIVAMLLEKGAEANDQFLVGSAKEGASGVMKLLLTRKWSDAALTDALAAAEAAKKEDTAELLRQAGAKSRMAVTVPPETMASYAGKYQGSGELTVEVKDSNLRIGSGGQLQLFRAIDERTWEPAERPGTMKVVFLVEGSKVTAVEFRWPQGSQKFERAPQ